MNDQRNKIHEATNGRQMPVTAEPIYGNSVIQAPDGQQLCRIANKRADWYLNHPEDIAYQVPNPGGPRIIRLRFEPSGREGADDPFLQGTKRNECAVCGHTDGLTRHHIMPWCYRRHMPQEVIQNCFHDIVPLCVECHCNYEETVHSYKLFLCDKYDVPIRGVKPPHDPVLGNAVKSAFALMRYSELMPPNRVEDLTNRIEVFLGRSPTEQDLADLTDIKGRWCRKARGVGGQSHGQMLVEKLALEDLQEFYEGWRQHFIDNTNPQFMPDHWSVTRKVKGT